MQIYGLAINTIEGAVAARIGYPLDAIKLFGVDARWALARLEISTNHNNNNVLILHRAFFNDETLVAVIDQLIEKGWIIINDIDDDLTYRAEFRANDYYCLRYCHAVTVSTPVLADSLSQFNPNTYVLPNAVPFLPEVKQSKTEPYRLVFGALNRFDDWMTIKDAVISAAIELGSRIEFVVIHDKAVFDSLPKEVPKQFFATLPYDQYMAQLARSHIALLPLNDTAFNRAKSDLKLIEACAAGCVPVFSSIVYGQIPIHEKIGVMAKTALDWNRALVQLVQNPDKWVQKRRLGHEYVSTCRMHSHQVLTRYTLYQQLLSNRDRLNAQRAQRVGSR
jgi:hypothetical protein